LSKKQEKNLSLNIKQLIKHENTKTLNYGQKVCSVYSPFLVSFFSFHLIWQKHACCWHEAKQQGHFFAKEGENQTKKRGREERSKQSGAL
jgi:hypothetical protein